MLEPAASGVSVDAGFGVEGAGIGVTGAAVGAVFWAGGVDPPPPEQAAKSGMIERMAILPA
jgi:hypothetical protein